MNAEEKLAKIAKIYGLNDSSNASLNLDGAIIDMDHTGNMDAVCRRTLVRVRAQLASIEDVLMDHDVHSEKG